MALDTWPIASVPRHLTYCQCPSTLGLLPMSFDIWPIANVLRHLAYCQCPSVKPARSDNGVQPYSAFIANVRATMTSNLKHPNFPSYVKGISSSAKIKFLYLVSMTIPNRLLTSRPNITSTCISATRAVTSNM
jgi:hypothetical protein